MAKIDLDRGVTIRKHKDSGMYIYMYKDTPGVYLSQHGDVLPDKLAQLVGFDTGRLSKERDKREKMAAFSAKVTKELALAEASDAPEVIVTRGDYSVIALPGGRANVVSGSAGKLNQTPLTRDLAMELLGALAGEEDDHGSETA
jgi:hypothetical protein